MKSNATNSKNLRSFTSLIIVGLVLSVGSPIQAGDDPVPDFALLDVNTTSSTYDELVSPRDYMGKISGWYFGHAT